MNLTFRGAWILCMDFVHGFCTMNLTFKVPSIQGYPHFRGVGLIRGVPS